MLGKTNLTMIESGATVTEITDYSWNATEIGGVNGTFQKAIYENGVLVGITKDGMIVYTEDGENWAVKIIELDNGDAVELNDVVWDGLRYIFTGNHTDNSSYTHGLLVFSDDLVNYDIRINVDKEEYFDLSSGSVKFFGLIVKDGKYFIITGYIQNGRFTCDSIMTDFETYAIKNRIRVMSATQVNIATCDAKVSKSTSMCIIQMVCKSLSGCDYSMNTSTDGRSFDERLLGNVTSPENFIYTFECKDYLYYYLDRSRDNYSLYKVINPSESAVMATGIQFGFVDAAYFNKCEIFINSHAMIVINPGESIADKTLDDFVEITYDFSMTSIVKAFDRLYVFGTGGNVLVSSNEINNEEAFAVRTLSARKALYDANRYTDKKWAELDARITAIEAGQKLNE